MIKKYRKKPVVIEAVQFTGENIEECQSVAPHAMSAYISNIRLAGKQCLSIQTLEGRMRADPGDWIIKDVAGEVYPCKPDIFAKTYEEIEK